MGLKNNYASLIVILFGIIAIVSVFLGWISMEGESELITGWELFNGKDGVKIQDMYDGYMPYWPLLVLVIGALTVILGALGLLDRGSKVTKIVAGVMGILIVVFAFLAYNAFIGEMTGAFGDIAKDFYGMAYGLYLAFASGIIVLLVGLLDAFDILPKFE